MSVDYGIYVIEQNGTGSFNRAMLFNIGASEAMKSYSYDCFIFHDVDLLPEDDRNIYRYYFSTKIDIHNIRAIRISKYYIEPLLVVQGSLATCLHI